MHTVYLILGSNLGDRKDILLKALDLIALRLGQLVDKSAIYQTAPWGVKDQPDYLNQVVKLITLLEPEDVLREVLTIEKDLGRVRYKKWESRIIDIDILFYDDAIIEKSDLIVPHPFLHLRRFVLTPLNEIAPNLIHPVLKKSISNLLANLTDDRAAEKNLS